MAKKREFTSELEQVNEIENERTEEKEEVLNPVFLEKNQGQVRYEVKGKSEFTFLLDGKEVTLPVVDDVLSIDVKDTYTIEWL